MPYIAVVKGISGELSRGSIAHVDKFFELLPKPLQIMENMRFNKSFVIPEGLIQFEITPVSASMELLFHAKCWFENQLFSFHLGIDHDCGEIRIIPMQALPYAVHELRDQLSAFITSQYD